MSFGKNLMDLRTSRGVTRKDLAEQLNIPYTTLRNYEMEQREPGHKFLIQVASYFSVSVDELIGHQMNGSSENKKTAPPVSGEAMKIAKDYDALDAHGRHVARIVVDAELERCASSLSKKYAAYQMPNVEQVDVAAGSGIEIPREIAESGATPDGLEDLPQ